MLLFKMFADRRRHRGPSKFSYRILRSTSGRYRIRVIARDGAFCSTVSLRHHTSDVATFDQVFANNDYNLRRLARWREILDLYNDLSHKGILVILDLGANIGLASLYFTKNWPKARVIAVKLDPENYQVMSENLAGIENALLLNASVASEDGAVKIIDPHAPSGLKRTELATPDAAETIVAFGAKLTSDGSRMSSLYC